MYPLNLLIVFFISTSPSIDRIYVDDDKREGYSNDDNNMFKEFDRWLKQVCKCGSMILALVIKRTESDCPALVGSIPSMKEVR